MRSRTEATVRDPRGDCRELPRANRTNADREARGASPGNCDTVRGPASRKPTREAGMIPISRAPLRSARHEGKSHDENEGLGRRRRGETPRPLHHRAPRPGPARRRDRDPLLRRLPLRHPPGPRRVGRRDLPDGARPRDRRPGDRRSATAVTRVRRRRPRRRRLPGRLVPRRATPAAHDTEQFCQKGAAFTYNGTEMDRKTPTYGGYSTRIVVDERFVAEDPGRARPGRAPRRSSAPGSPPTRRSGSGTARRATGSASSASAGSATWR